MNNEVRIGMATNFQSKFINSLINELQQKAAKVQAEEYELTLADVFAYKVLESNGLFEENLNDPG